MALKGSQETSEAGHALGDLKRLKAEHERLRAKFRNKEEAAEQDEEEGTWLLTYADMVTILLGVFVILYSLSSVDSKKFEQTLQQIQHSLGGKTGDPRMAGGSPLPIVPVLPELEDLAVLMQRMQGIIQEMGLEGSIDLAADQRGVTLYAVGGTLFESGQSEITPDGRQFLLRLAPPLQQVPYKILIEGHTDDVPISTGRFPSNWDLSTARASSVVRLLIEAGGIDPVRLSAAGHAHYRPRIDPTPENRAKNRRVEIVILRE